MVKSEVDFVIVGPILEYEGVLVQSETATIELLGVANKLYQIGPEQFYDQYSMLLNAEFSYLWSDRTRVDFLGREASLLLCWGFKKKAKDRVIKSQLNNKNEIKKEFNLFLAQARNILRDFMEIEDNLSEKDYELELIDLRWLISPLMLDLFLDSGK